MFEQSWIYLSIDSVEKAMRYLKTNIFSNNLNLQKIYQID